MRMNFVIRIRIRLEQTGFLRLLWQSNLPDYKMTSFSLGQSLCGPFLHHFGGGFRLGVSSSLEAGYVPPCVGCPVKSSTGSRLFERESGLSDILARELSFCSFAGDADGFANTFVLFGDSVCKISGGVSCGITQLDKDGSRERLKLSNVLGGGLFSMLSTSVLQANGSAGGLYVSELNPLIFSTFSTSITEFLREDFLEEGTL